MLSLKTLSIVMTQITNNKFSGLHHLGKFEDLDFERCNNILTQEIKSIMLETNVLKSNKNKKEVKNDLLSMIAPPIIQSYSMNKIKCILYSLDCNNGKENLSIK